MASFEGGGGGLAQSKYNIRIRSTRPCNNTKGLL